MEKTAEKMLEYRRKCGGHRKKNTWSKVNSKKGRERIVKCGHY